MVQAVIIRDSKARYKGFHIKGHAGFSEHGYDIVCAAVSVLAQNTANSIEAFTEDPVSGEMDEARGTLDFTFLGIVSHESVLLMDSMILGLRSIAETYGERYIKIRFEEV